jgi:hypothetical protein
MASYRGLHSMAAAKVGLAAEEVSPELRQGLSEEALHTAPSGSLPYERAVFWAGNTLLLLLLLLLWPLALQQPCNPTGHLDIASIELTGFYHTILS